MAIYGDNQILVAGHANMGATGYDFAVVLFEEDGDPDTGFGTQGVATVAVADGSGADYCYGVMADADGRVVLAGRMEDAYGLPRHFVAARLTDAGQPDASFGDGGVVITPVGDNSEIFYAESLDAAIDSRGRIVLGGYAYIEATEDFHFAVVRYLDDGQLDPSFGGTGIVTTEIDSGYGTGGDTIQSVAIDQADRILATGTVGPYSNPVVVRYNPDGTLTTSTNQYVYSPRYIDAVICRDVADGATLVEGSRLYYTSDANHNVTALLSADGDVVERTVYTPYGQAQIYAGNWSETYETSVFDNTHLYTGRVYDRAIDLYNFRARWYHAGVGGFTTRDPSAADVNLYRYVGSNPTVYVDPAGLAAISAGPLVTSARYLGNAPSLWAFGYVIPKIQLTFAPGAAGKTWRQENRTQIDLLDKNMTVRARIVSTVVDLQVIPNTLTIIDSQFTESWSLVSRTLEGAVLRGALTTRICSFQVQSSSLTVS